MWLLVRRERETAGGGGGKRSRCGTPTPAQTPPRLCEDGSRASLSVSPRNFFDENLKSEASSTRPHCRNLWLQLRALLRGSPRPPGWGRPVRAGGTGRRPAAGPAPRLTRVCFSSGLKKRRKKRSLINRLVVFKRLSASGGQNPLKSRDRRGISSSETF